MRPTQSTPRTVSCSPTTEATAKLFSETAKHYQFISSISVYGSLGERPDTIDETEPVSTVEDDKLKGVNTIRQAMPFYGALKARC